MYQMTDWVVTCKKPRILPWSLPAWQNCSTWHSCSDEGRCNENRVSV